jgi:UDP-glucose 4-epimerase
MKILVTGGAGFIGSHIVDAYISKGYEVVIVDNLSSGKKENANPKAKFYYCDITRLDALKKIFERERPAIVNHHAAQINVRHSVTHPQDDATINILGSLNLLECCREFKIKKFIYASSGGAVYGDAKRLPCTENTPVNPLCPYGVSKHTIEHYLYLYSSLYGLDYVILRYSNVYGPRQDPHGEAGVVAIFTQLLRKGKAAVINGDGNQTRDFVFVEDVAQANTSATELLTKSHIFNIGSGNESSVNEIYSNLKAILKSKNTAVHREAVPGEVRRIYLDHAKATKELEWKPRISLKMGLKKTVEWFR